MATFFYESMWDLAGFFLLHSLRKRMKKPGDLFLLYLVWYGFGRMIIEGLRTDSLMWGPFRVSQVLSLALVLLGGAWFTLRRVREKSKAI
jgi:phosphatidylglycerol:prolipoprotein diacylglycerol transferase